MTVVISLCLFFQIRFFNRSFCFSFYRLAVQFCCCLNFSLLLQLFYVFINFFGQLSVITRLIFQFLGSLTHTFSQLFGNVIKQKRLTFRLVFL